MTHAARETHPCIAGICQIWCHCLGFARRLIEVAFHFDDRACDADPAVREIGNSADHHESIGVHAYSHVALFLFFDEPAGILDAVVGDVVRVRTGFAFESVFLQIDGIGYARLCQGACDVTKDFILRGGLKDSGRENSLIKPQQQSGVDMLLGTGQLLRSSQKVS